MKKMWKLNNKAVSPVIATILMVAITVVLAAVLYVMVMGFGGGGSNETPSGSLTYEKTGSLKYKIVISSISKNDILWSDVKFFNDTTEITAIHKLDNEYVTAGSYIEIDTTAGPHTVNLLYVPTGNNIASISFTAT